MILHSFAYGFSRRVYDLKIRKAHYQSDMKGLKQLLSCDPRPQYLDDPEREFGIVFNGIDVKFKVGGGVLRVTDFVYLQKR